MIVHSKAIIRSVMTSPFLTRLQVWLSSSPFLQRQQDRGREAMIWAIICLFPSTWDANGSMHGNKATLPLEKKQNEAQCASRSPQEHTTPAEEGGRSSFSLRQDAQLLVANA